MDGIIINELSLSGQFHDSQDFWKNGMPPFYKALQDARSFGVGYLFKQGSFYGAQATPDKTLHDLLTAPEARIIDEAKRLYPSGKQFHEETVLLPFVFPVLDGRRTG